MATPHPPHDAATVAWLLAEGRLEQKQLAKAREQARRWNTGTGAALMAEGSISHQGWAAGISGLPLANLLLNPPDDALLDPEDRCDYLDLGVLPWREEATPEGEPCLILAAEAPDSPAVAAWAAARFPSVALGWAATTKFDVLWAMQNAFDDIADHEAREALLLAAPHLSAKQTITRPQVVSVAIAGSVLLFGLATAPMPTVVFVSGFVIIVYMLSFGFRFLLTWVGAHDDVDISVTPEEVAALNPDELSVHTVLVPMYREADDEEIIEAAKALRAEGIFEIIRVPASHPRTKPKACNYARASPAANTAWSSMPRTCRSPTS